MSRSKSDARKIRRLCEDHNIGEFHGRAQMVVRRHTTGIFLAEASELDAAMNWRPDGYLRAVYDYSLTDLAGCIQSAHDQLWAPTKPWLYWTVPQLAAALGVPVGRLRRLCREHGLRSRALSNDDVRMLQGLLIEGAKPCV